MVDFKTLKDKVGIDDVAYSLGAQPVILPS